MVKYFIGLILFFSVSAQAQDIQWRSWSNADYAREAAFATLLLLDYKQTKQIHNFCDGRTDCSIHERNALLGKNPTPTKTRNYFIGALIGHIVITGFLAPEERKMWQWAGIAVQTSVVISNHQVGLKIRF